MILSLRAAAPFALAVPLSLVACAPAAPAPPAAPATPAQAPPPGVFDKSAVHEISPVDQEMLAIGRAEEDIDRLFPEARPTGGVRRGAKGAPTSPAEPAKPADHPGAGDSCTIACKALASMMSSAERLCRLAGADDGRCDDARARVNGARASMMSSAERLCRLAGADDGRCDDARARVNGARARVKAACPACAAAPAPMAPPGPAKGTPPPTGPAPGMPGSSTTPIP
jgi:hypothetical protein